MNEQPIRIGIVGAGTNTRARHIPGLLALDGVEIVGICNRTRESGQAVAGAFEIEKIYEDWRQAVADQDTNAIVIGTWPYLHCPVTLAALEAGKHVLCEARMAMNASEAHAMLRAGRARPDLVAQIVPSPMTLHVDAGVRKLLEDGYLGDLLTVEIHDSSGFVDRKAPMTWRQDAALSGMNVLTMGIWYEALMRWVGPAGRVAAMGKTFVDTRPGPDGSPCTASIPDHLAVLAEMECGAMADLRFSAVAGLDERRAALFGTEATLLLRDGKLLGGRRGDDRFGEVPVPAELVGRWRVEEEFVAAIRGREEVKLTTFDDGVRYMEFTEAVARSMAGGAAVDLPLTDLGQEPA